MDPDPSATEGEQEEEEEELDHDQMLTPSFPMVRVKKIVKIDQEIKKLTSEALYLITLSADLFIRSLAEGARDVAIGKKRRIIKLDHLRSAVRGHGPTADFLLDCLPNLAQPPVQEKRRRADVIEKPLPPRARRIDDFFQKPAAVEPAE